MQHKSLGLSLKSIADDGTFEGLLSPYGNVDQGNDVVEPGAFTKSLQDNGNSVPMLWQHKPDCPIGELHLDDREDGLYCSGKLLLAIPEAQKAYELLKANIIKGLSIGYETVKAKSVNGVRHLSEIKLFEGSVVTFPMNLAATVSSVKADDLEAKEGRTVSAATHKALSTAHEHMKAAAECLAALMAPEDDPNALAQKAHAEFIGNMLGLLR